MDMTSEQGEMMIDFANGILYVNNAIFDINMICCQILKYNNNTKLAFSYRPKMYTEQ